MVIKNIAITYQKDGELRDSQLFIDTVATVTMTGGEESMGNQVSRRISLAEAELLFKAFRIIHPDFLP